MYLIGVVADRAVRVPLFRHGGYGDSVGGVHRHRAVAHSPRYPVWPAGGADRGILHAAPTLQWRFARLSARLDHRRRAGADHRRLRCSLTYHSGYAIAIYIAACAVVSLVAAALMPDYTGKDISTGI